MCFLPLLKLKATRRNDFEETRRLRYDLFQVTNDTVCTIQKTLHECKAYRYKVKVHTFRTHPNKIEWVSN